MDTPRIYVACLASYNAGTLHGRWIDADEGVDHIGEEVAAMLKESPEPGAEEWAIHDYELGGISIGEWERFERVARIGELLGEHGDAFAAFASHVDDDQIDSFEDAYAGESNSVEDFAEQWYEDAGHLADVPDHIRYHIDWSSVWREMSADIFSVYRGGNLYFFRSNA